MNRRHSSGLAIATLLVIATAARSGPITLGSAGDQTFAPEFGTSKAKEAMSPELEKALKLFRDRDYTACQEMLREARKNNSGLPPAPLMLARAFFSTAQTARGRVSLEQAAAEAPEYPGVYVVFGRLALEEHRYTDALLHFQKATVLTRSGAWNESQQRYFSREASSGLASVAEARKDWPAARAALTECLSRDPDDASAHQRLGTALFASNQSDAALAEFEKAARSDIYPRAEVSMAWLCTANGDMKKAGEWMDSAVKKEPDNARTLMENANWLLIADRVGEAKSRAEAAAKLAPEMKGLKAVQGSIAWQMKDYAAAEAFFDAHCRQVPGDFIVENQLVLSLIEQTDSVKRQRALQLAEIHARLVPGSGDALATLARVYYVLGRAEDADRVARAARSCGSGTSDSAYYLARLAAVSGQTEDAKRLLRTALETPGRFSFRKEAKEWQDRLEAKQRP
jgi:tetratricopeptide (TPR) repeat protein